MSALTVSTVALSAAARSPMRPAVLVSGVARTAGGVRPTPRRGLRLTRRGRLAAWVGVAMVVLGGALGTASANADGPASSIPVESYLVGSGDTLWQIALVLASPGQDVRDVVDELIELNGLSHSGIRAGQRLLLPAGSEL